MKLFGIVTNEMKDPNREVTCRIRDYLVNRGAECVICKKASEIKCRVDCILVLGGDGTMLQAAKETAGRNIPLLGINLGTLGYLADVELNTLEEALERLLSDDYETEERMMLEGTLYLQEGTVHTAPALNDISITRCGRLRIIRLNIYVNGNYLCQWNADGIILSTPTGSTGYNLSAGGPLVIPGAGLLLLTPICAHTLNARSIVLREYDEVVVEIAEGRHESRQILEVSSDGSEKYTIETGERICIRKAKETTTIIKLNKSSFLETLQKKMSDEK